MPFRHPLGLSLLLVLPTLSLASPYSQLVIFGDSLSDSGQFPDLLGPTPKLAPGGPFDIERIAAQFRAIRLPEPASLLPQWTGKISAASAAVSAANRARLGQRALGITALVAACIGFFAAGNLAVVWLGIGIFGLVKFFGSSVEHAPFKKAYAEADARVHALEQGFVDRLGLGELVAVRGDVEQWIQSYRGLDRDQADDLQRLKASREARKRDEYLDRFLIRRASIAGIGPAKTATLASYGIETAADIKASAVHAVPGFGDAMTAKLLAWRKGHEDRFRYNATPDAADVQAENAVRANWQAKRVDLQTKISSAMAALQVGPQQVATRAQNSDPALMDALERREQAAHDLKAIGLPVPSTPTRVIATPRPSAPPMSPTPPASTLRPGAGPSHQTSATPSCPQCGAAMRRRTARRGHRPGNQFWGCSNYPACRGVRN